MILEGKFVVCLNEFISGTPWLPERSSFFPSVAYATHWWGHPIDHGSLGNYSIHYDISSLHSISCKSVFRDINQMRLIYYGLLVIIPDPTWMSLRLRTHTSSYQWSKIYWFAFTRIWNGQDEGPNPEFRVYTYENHEHMSEDVYNFNSCDRNV